MVKAAHGSEESSKKARIQALSENRIDLEGMNGLQKAWDRNYCGRGRLWGGGVKNMPELSPGVQVLELGSGDGKTLAAMIDRAWKVSALDVSPEALRLSHLTLGSKVEHIRANACLLPFKKDSFDAIFAFHLTGHQLLPGRKAIAFEVAQVLRSGGKLFIKEFRIDDLRAEKGKEIEPQTFQRGTGIITHYFTENEVIDLFHELKLDSIHIHRWLMRIRGQNLLRSELEGIFLKI